MVRLAAGTLLAVEYVQPVLAACQALGATVARSTDETAGDPVAQIREAAAGTAVLTREQNTASFPAHLSGHSTTAP